ISSRRRAEFPDSHQADWRDRSRDGPAEDPAAARALPAPASGGAPNARGPETNRIERVDRSRIAAATSPKNKASPRRRLTPLTIGVWRVAPASRRIVSATCALRLIAVRKETP